ncbi:GNAT family N-acetyltransferase [Anaerocolumna sp. AGMB13025]|uniref:GNAT family N-acetyltransferase n=1 Tax=Anaerocolumna sp. AGMB13025 TaxID=3039116 RepID=UPI00241F2211|nr:GNAT family N-acetyltransferase [Anaerocolumna sp. AGMB13025]WFR55664.1 GNAT family N-acetyltransferase [Anaerocolumna sp. AGMB13025]
MRAEKLNRDEKGDFITYCKKHRSEIDDSFLYDNDLEKFEPDEDNPTFVIKENGVIVAVVSLVMDDYHRSGKNGRFRIFHSEKQDINLYSILLEEILKYTKGLNKVFSFVPFVNKELSGIMENLQFKAERYVFLLMKEIKERPQITFPEGFYVRTFESGKDEIEWCKIRNTAFLSLKGNSTPITPDMITKQLSKPDYLEGGFMFLMHEDKPVGIIRGAKDEYEGEPAIYIGPIAILPEYQGKGLGRQLLRTMLEYADKLKYKKTVLCVNAENDKAKELYLKEGFVQVEGVASYEYHLI